MVTTNKNGMFLGNIADLDPTEIWPTGQGPTENANDVIGMVFKQKTTGLAYTNAGLNDIASGPG